MISVCKPALVRIVQPGFIVRLRGRNNFCGGGDVFFQQRGELVTCGISVIRLDRITNVRLILQQSFCSCGFVRQIGGSTNDEYASPGEFSPYLLLQTMPAIFPG
ncbi:MAG TPA: hypothetical protein VGJ66_12030 [Pyrinomonadaceae bacterium]